MVVDSKGDIKAGESMCHIMTQHVIYQCIDVNAPQTCNRLQPAKAHRSRQHAMPIEAFSGPHQTCCLSDRCVLLLLPGVFCVLPYTHQTCSPASLWGMQTAWAQHTATATSE